MLDAIDEAIERTEAVVTSQPKELHHALLHELLTRGVPGWHTGWQNVPSLGTVPSDWAVMHLGDVADITFSSVDKKTITGEVAVALCNYTDVFYNRRIANGIPFWLQRQPRESAPSGVYERVTYSLQRTPKTPDELGIPATVTADMPNVLCGYHLGLARPRSDLVEGRFLAEAMRSQAVRREFARIANGITRFGVTLKATRSLPVPIPTICEQLRIADTLGAVDSVLERVQTARATLQSFKESVSEILLSGERQISSVGC